LGFAYTNESLGAVVAGLEPSKDDRILAIAGSGDQAFALAESGAKIKVVDRNPAQLDYVRRRLECLRAGDYEGFFGCESQAGRIDYRMAAMIYFDMERFGRIGQNAERIEVAEGACPIQDNPEEFRGRNKVYLSNVNELSRGRELKKLIRGIGQNAESPLMIYFSSNSGFRSPSFRFGYISPEWGLTVNRECSNEARRLEELNRAPFNYAPIVLTR